MTTEKDNTTQLEIETIMNIEDFHYKIFLEQVRNITHKRFKVSKKRTRLLNHMTYEIHNLNRSLTKKDIPRDETIEENSYQAAKDLKLLDDYLGGEQSMSEILKDLENELA